MSNLTPIPDYTSGTRNFINSGNDHAGVAITISALMMSWAVMTLMVRIWMRKYSSGPFGMDDLLCGVATVVAVVQMVISCVAISWGFGKALYLVRPGDIVRAEKAVYVAQLLYIVTNALSKGAAALLLARIVFIKVKVYACYAMLGASLTWGLASVLYEAVRCTEHAPWAIIQPTCPDTILGWDVITAIDIALEFALICLPIWLVWKLQTGLWRKVTVVYVFGLRLPLISAAILRLHYLRAMKTSSEPFLDGVPTFICMNVEMFYSLLSTTIPTLKPFISAFNTGWGTYDSTGHSGYGKASASRDSSHALRSLERKSKAKSGKSFGNSFSSSQPDRSGSRDASLLQSSYGKHVTQIRSTAANPTDTLRNDSHSSASSQQMFIRQTTTCAVHFEQHEAPKELDTEDSIDFAPPTSYSH